MTARDDLVERIARVAMALGDDLPRVVFVGAAVPALYDEIDDADIRPTNDIDCIIDTSRAGFYALAARLRARGFREASDPGAPLCRFVLAGASGADEVKVDVMPIDTSVLGFTNRWYADVMTSARTHTLPNGLLVAAVSPLLFVATKFEAFKGRGRGDYLASHDLEDALALIAAAADVRWAIADSSDGVGAAVRAELVTLREPLLDALPAHFRGDAAGQERGAAVGRWLLGLRAESL